MSSERTASDLDVDAVEVYWRPGCGYCQLLLRALGQAAVAVRMHNIWEDESARQFVREQNRDHETVPTVAVGELVLTNPEPASFLELLGRRHPALVGAGLA